MATEQQGQRLTQDEAAKRAEELKNIPLVPKDTEKAERPYANQGK